MKSFAAIASAELGLMTWFRTGAWRRSFDRGTWLRAEGYLNEIVDPEIQHSAGQLLVCQAGVRGSRGKTYTTRISLIGKEASWHLDSQCSCPVGLFCKHGAAMLLSTLSILLPPAKPKLNGNEGRPALDPRVLDWLEEMKAGAVVNEKVKSAAADSKFLAFCLRMEENSYLPRPTWYLSMRVGMRKKEGLSIQEGLASADPSNPPKYMAKDDFGPAGLYHQKKRRMGAWGELRCEGDGWEEMLDSMMATDRFFICHPQTREWKPTKVGELLEAKPGWITEEDGALRPVLEFADGRSRSVLPVIPPYYVDHVSGEMGKLTGELPPKLLLSWAKGPKIPSGQMETLSARLPTVSAELPVPQAMEKVELPAVVPVPHLRIIRKDWRISGYAYHYIVGELRYRYGDGPLLEPLENARSKAVHSRVSGGVMHLQPRDFKAEQAGRRKLTSMGLSLTADVIPSQPMAPGAQSSYMFQSPDGGHDEWLNFLERGGKTSLQEAGWIVEVTRESGLQVRAAGELFADLEESPEHGIDWFKFDAAFELDGRKVSLIPIIAQAIRMDLPPLGSPDLPEFFLFPAGEPEDGMIRFPARRLLEFIDQVRHLFQGRTTDGPLKIDRMAAAGVADAFGMDDSDTIRALAELSRNLRNIGGLPAAEVPASVQATLRDYQKDGFRWLRFLGEHGLNGILADDMGLGKTLQTLAHIAAEKNHGLGLPSLVIAPTSVVPNWAVEARKFTPDLKIIVLHGKERVEQFKDIGDADLVIISYALAYRDIEKLAEVEWNVCVLDEAQYIKNSKAVTTRSIRRLKARHRLCLSGTPMENHLGELWSLMQFLMPGFLGDETHFNSSFRRPIERNRSSGAQLALNRRISPLILRRTKDQVVKELPPKTEIAHSISLSKKQQDLYESVRAAMDKRVRDAIAEKGLAKSHIIVLDALLKLRQICCHPKLLKTTASADIDSAKLDYLIGELLPTLIEEGRRILLFSSFTSMLAEIGKQLDAMRVPFLSLTGASRNRAELVSKFQEGTTPVFLISLKAGGTGLNLTAADTIIHYDPWWNPAAENQATDRAHRIGQEKPVFVHKLICAGSIEERIQELQKHKAGLIEALLSEETTKLKIDTETLSHLLAPLE